MANICCVAYDSVAHLDFGGQGYLSVALELRNKGHNVFWLISSVYNGGDFQSGNVKKTLLTHKFVVYNFTGIYLSSNCSIENNKSENEVVEQVSDFFIKQQVECVLIDRICRLAQYSANKANIKWAGIGTCGRDWSFRFSPYHDKLALSPRLNKYASNDVNYWAKSPYLNVSFLPFNFYGARGGEHCLFIPTIKESTVKKYILVTFGNSMPVDTQYLLVEYLHNCAVLMRDEYFLLLTGNNSEVFSLSVKQLSKVSNVRIEKWMDYDLAFQGAKLSIGHGGTAHLWYSIAYNMPMITLPALADQFYNSIRVQKLGIGVGLYLYRGKRSYFPDFFNTFTQFSGISLAKEIRKYTGKSLPSINMSRYDGQLEDIILEIENLL